MTQALLVIDVQKAMFDFDPYDGEGAGERGFHVTLVADGHSTVDSRVLKARDIVAHRNETLGGSYAKLVKAADVAF